MIINCKDRSSSPESFGGLLPSRNWSTRYSCITAGAHQVSRYGAGCSRHPDVHARRLLDRHHAPSRPA